MPLLPPSPPDPAPPTLCRHPSPLQPSRPQVFILPTIRINNAQYRGKLAVTEVLRAICAGFLEGNRPDACNRVRGWGRGSGWMGAGGWACMGEVGLATGCRCRFCCAQTAWELQRRAAEAGFGSGTCKAGATPK